MLWREETLRRELVLTEAKSHCFHSKQIGHHTLSNPSEDVGKHIESCPSCQKKVQDLVSEKKLIQSHFNRYQIPEDIRRELKSELNEVMTSLTPKMKDKVVKGTKKFNSDLKLNSFHFLMHMIQPKNLKILFATGLFFLIARSLINT